MNTIHNNGENDKSLNDDLDTLSRAYRQLPDDEPPQLLDQAILSSAHRAVEKKPHWMKFGWLHGLTTAAVVVLALSIIINQRDQAPDFDDAIKVSAPAGLARDKADNKQTEVRQTENFRMEEKKEDSTRLDLPPGAAVSAVSESETLEVSVGDQASDSESRARHSIPAQESLSVKSRSIDSDTAIRELVIEEPMMDEADLAGDAPERQPISKQSQPAAITAIPAKEAGMPSETDPGIEELLLSIIKLKQAGNETWITELSKFRQSYPDYPLPEELSE